MVLFLDLLFPLLILLAHINRPTLGMIRNVSFVAAVIFSLSRFLQLVSSGYFSSTVCYAILANGPPIAYILSVAPCLPVALFVKSMVQPVARCLPVMLFIERSLNRKAYNAQ